MNREKLNLVFATIAARIDQLHVVQVAYTRLGEDRGSNLKLVLGDYWKLEIARSGSQINRGLDMIVLGLQKHLSAESERLKAEIKSLKAEIDKEVGGAA